MTGGRGKKKKYDSYTGFPGGLKSIIFDKYIKKNP